MIDTKWEERLRQYITSIVQNNGHKVIAINNMPDHLHLFVGLNPKQAISDLMRLVKCDSSEWMNDQKLTQRKFQWQEGYGAFSYSRSHIDAVVHYIDNQQEHHKMIAFLDEYKELLKRFDIGYKEQYIFTLPEE